jgi:hypothetical protein
MLLANGRLAPFQPVTKGRKRPILLKKLTLVSTVDKSALEIEIFTLSRGFRAQISRSSMQKGGFSDHYAVSLVEP